MTDSHSFPRKVINITDPDQEFRETPTFGKKAGVISPRNFLSRPSPKIFPSPTPLFNIKSPVNFSKPSSRRDSLTEQTATEETSDSSNTILFPPNLGKYPFKIMGSPSSIPSQSSPSREEESEDGRLKNPLLWKRQTKSFETDLNNKPQAPFFKNNLDQILLPITSITPCARPGRPHLLKETFQLVGNNITRPKEKHEFSTLSRPRSKETLPRIDEIMLSPPRECTLQQTISHSLLKTGSRSKNMIRLDPIKPEPHEVKASLDSDQFTEIQKENDLNRPLFTDEHMTNVNHERTNHRVLYSQPDTFNLFAVSKPISHDLKRRPKLPNISRELPEVFRVPSKPELRKEVATNGGLRPSFSNPRILKRDTQSLSPKLLINMKPTKPATKNCFGQDWANRIANFERNYIQE